MDIIDLHGDALYKLWRHGGRLSFADADELETNKRRLAAGGIRAQAFALFVPPEVKEEHKFQAVLDQLHYFHEKVLAVDPDMKPIACWDDFDRLQDGEIGAMLTLEGVDAIGTDEHKLALLYRLGVMSVGLTWNEANLAADGAMEPRNAGLTRWGRQVVAMNNRHRRLTDVSHLGERAFWETVELADYPIASHSNARAHCDHPRNLTDGQAAALFAKGATVHVVYNPPFTKSDRNATISDLIRHIDHFCSLGGVSYVGLGSDLDGIRSHIPGLEHAGLTQNLINELLKTFKEEEVRGFASANFLRCRPH
ncbi:dipeptidase [Paenibacillus hodogayensis]|uniref:Dipeptidase n=1 Tax=Paenibacillus hodogayensis TaxID=279208 RepID=A0ABV5VQR5_9BACL